MKRALLLIVVPALLVVLGFAQIPAASINTDQTKIKGCLSGTDGNYTVAEGNTGHLFKITTSSVDLKPHVGHDVTIIGQTANGVSSAPAASGIAVTELNMISEHCSAAAAAPAATVSTPSETAVIPPAAAAAAPAATAGTPSQAVSTPAAAGTAPTASPSSDAVSTPAAAGTAPPATATIPPETDSTPVAATAHSSRLPARSRRLPAKPAVGPATPDTTASTSSEADSNTAATPTTPAAAGSTSSEAASAPAAAPTTAKAAAKGGSLWILILCALLVIVVGTMVPFLSRWRKRKMLARTGAQNLSFTNEASPQQDTSAPPITRKAA